MSRVYVEAQVGVTEVFQAAIKKEGLSYVLSLLAAIVTPEDLNTGETLALLAHLSRMDSGTKGDVYQAVKEIAERE